MKRQSKGNVKPIGKGDPMEQATSKSPEEAFAFDLEEVLGEDTPQGPQKVSKASVKGSNVPEVVRPPK